MQHRHAGSFDFINLMSPVRPPIEELGHGHGLRFQRARELRKKQTAPETQLWHRLRADRLNGFNFRRQFPIGSYIVDFCHPQSRLVVELDGAQHAEPAQLAADRQRTKYIEQCGFKVLRFWNNEVAENLNGVLETISSAALIRAK